MVDIRRAAHGAPERQNAVHAAIGLLPAIVIAGCIIAIYMMIPLAEYTGRDFGFFTRDPTQTGGLPRYAGYLSSLGVIAWGTGAVIALFAAVILLLGPQDDSIAGFLGYFGAITAALAVDDLFLIHEHFIFGEDVMFAGYALAAGVGLVMFRTELRREKLTYAFVAVAILSVSIAVDSRQDAVEHIIGDARIMIEDGAKFLGAACWSIFLCKVSARALLGLSLSR